MSKARKRHRQPWWKRNKYNGKWRKRRKLNPPQLVSFDAMMRVMYPKDIGGAS